MWQQMLREHLRKQGSVCVCVLCCAANAWQRTNMHRKPMKEAMCRAFESMLGCTSLRHITQ